MTGAAPSRACAGPLTDPSTNHATAQPPQEPQDCLALLHRGRVLDLHDVDAEQQRRARHDRVPGGAGAEEQGLADAGAVCHPECRWVDVWILQKNIFSAVGDVPF